MLLWQQKRAPKQRFCYQLVLVVITIHLVALCLFFSGGNKGVLHVFSKASYTDAHIVLLPLYKQVLVAKASAAKSTASLAKKRVPKKTTITPLVAKPKPIANVQKKTSVAKAPAKNVNKKTIAKKEVPKKCKPPLPAKVKPPVEQPLVENTLVHNEPEPIYVGRMQMDALQVQQAIVQELDKHWHPPAGLSSTLQTVLCLHIGADGALEQIKTEQASGVLAYDMHARSAAYAMKFPRACWAKQLMITFTQ